MIRKRPKNKVEILSYIFLGISILLSTISLILMDTPNFKTGATFLIVALIFWIASFYFNIFKE